MDSLLAVAFPTQCCLCGDELSAQGRLRICGVCWASLEPWKGPACLRCGLPFSSSHAVESSVGQCGACRAGEPAFDAVRSFGIYTGKLRQVVLRLKFGGDGRLGLRLGELLSATWDALPLRRELDLVIVPVPLHPARQRERGFNQSELLAAGLARALGRQYGAAEPRIAKSWLRRKRATPPQTGLSVAARRENLRGAFEVVNPDAVRGRAIVLVDDVMTTGATVSACARALKRAGAEKVMGVTLARATPQFPDLAPATADNAVDGLGSDWT